MAAPDPSVSPADTIRRQDDESIALWRKHVGNLELGEQRAIRAVAASLHQVNMNGRSPILDEALAMSIVHSPMWKEMRELLISCYMDGMAIGWKARELSQE